MCIVHQRDLESPSAFECAQSGCRECQDALVRRHEGLVHTVLRRQSRDGLAYEELLQEGRVAVWKAILGFDPQRGVAFSTYAGRAIRNRIWSAVERNKRPQGWLKPREAPNPLALAEDRLWQGEVGTALLEAVSRLPGRQRQVIVAACGWDGQPPRTLSEIGQEWGVSRQGASYWYSKALISLRLPAISGRLRRLWGQNRRQDYQRSQVLSRTWQRQQRPRRRP
jgi:RNA polymerase sigma factor (sigma-70 family)